MRWFEDIVRLILVISVITTSIFYNFDFRMPLIVLSLVYFFQSVILYPLMRDNLLRYLMYTLDAVYILYVIHITDQVYLSIFWFMLIVKITSQLEMAVLLIPSAIITGFSFYKSGFYEFNLLFLSVASLVVIFNFILQKHRRDKEFNALIELNKNLYRDNLICNDKKEFFERYYNIKESVKKLREGKIAPKDFCDSVYGSLNCSMVVLVDISTGSYFSRGDISVDDKMIASILDGNVELLKKFLGVKFAVLKDIGGYRLTLIYKDYILIDKSLIDAID